MTRWGSLGANLPAAWPVVALPSFLWKYLSHHLAGQLTGCLWVVGAVGVARSVAGRKHLIAFRALQHRRSGQDEAATVDPCLRGEMPVSLVLQISQLLDRVGLGLYLWRKKRQIY